MDHTQHSPIVRMIFTCLEGINLSLPEPSERYVELESSIVYVHMLVNTTNRENSRSRFSSKLDPGGIPMLDIGLLSRDSKSLPLSLLAS